MIPTPAGWRGHVAERCVLLSPNDGSERMVIRYDDRLTPCRDVDALVVEHLTRRPEPLNGPELLSIENLTTDEGEFAALVSATGVVGDQRVHCAIGFVLFDECYARISGATTVEAARDELIETVRDLVHRDRYLLGERPRRYRHERLPGWREIRRPGLQRAWLADDDQAVITTWPAMPHARTSAESFFSSLAAQDGAAGVTATGGQSFQAVLTPHLHGVEMLSATQLDEGRTLNRRAVVLSDARYAYAVQLESTAGPSFHCDAFATLVDSILPIPSPVIARDVAGVMSYWAD